MKTVTTKCGTKFQVVEDNGTIAKIKEDRQIGFGGAIIDMTFDYPSKMLADGMKHPIFLTDKDFKQPKVTTKIKKSVDGEYRVRLFIDGKYQAGGDYFTDDKKDAVSTAKHMAEHAVSTDKDTDDAKREQTEYDEETLTL